MGPGSKVPLEKENKIKRTWKKREKMRKSVKSKNIENPNFFAYMGPGGAVPLEKKRKIKRKWK